MKELDELKWMIDLTPMHAGVPQFKSLFWLVLKILTLMHKRIEALEADYDRRQGDGR